MSARPNFRKLLVFWLAQLELARLRREDDVMAEMAAAECLRQLGGVGSAW